MQYSLETLRLDKGDDKVDQRRDAEDEAEGSEEDHSFSTPLATRAMNPKRTIAAAT